MELNKINVGVIDYGVGNLTSIFNFFRKLNTKPTISKDPEVLEKLDLLVLPGVGTFEMAMKNISSGSLSDYIKTVKNKKILGICLGAQILFEKSYEGGEFKGLGLIPGQVVSIKSGTNTGWDQIDGNYVKNIFKEISPHFYFNHSFKISCDDEYVAAYNINPVENIPSIIISDNLFGFQFHPEKSQIDGEILIRNIINYNG